MTEKRQYPISIATDAEVAGFIARYGKPYDPETDDYDRTPFIADIREGKNDPIYNAHSYHTKVPPRAIMPYILHYTEPGDIILDPFCGSGMTGVAALMCNDPPEDIVQSVPGASTGTRRTILNDLSPAACHIAYNYCTAVDVEALTADFERLQAVVKEQCAWFYRTEHYEPAAGVYDPANPEVACRLKNPPKNIVRNALLAETEQTWELLDRVEVESRMGLAALAERPLPAEVQQFICIPATIQYSIWSDVYTCHGMMTFEEPTGRINKRTGRPVMKTIRRARGCGTPIVLWGAAVNHDTGKVHELFACPNCSLKWKKTQLKRSATVPVLTNYEYIGLKLKGKGRNAGVGTARFRTSRSPTSRELSIIHEMKQVKDSDARPEAQFDPKGAQYRRNALSGRQVKSVSDLYTARNYRVMTHLWRAIHGSNTNVPLMLFALTAIAAVASRRNRWPQFAVISGTIYIPSISVEMNAWEQYTRRLCGLLEYAKSRQSGQNKEDFVVRLGDAANLNSIATNSVDYVFADPPFGSNFYYSEVNLLWECFLSQLTDERNDAIVHRKEDGGYKDLSFYSSKMQAAFCEMFRVLKPGRWATVEFNNSDGQVFEAIKQAARHAGFLIENMVFLDKVQKTFKQLKGEKGEEDVVGHDVIFNLRKPVLVLPRIEPKPGLSEIKQELKAAGKTPELLEHLVTGTIRDHLRTLPERVKKDPKTYTEEHRSTPFLNTMLMNALIPKGVDVSQINLPYIEQVCCRYFRKVDNRWYLRDEAVGTHRPEGTKGELFGTPEEELSILDETTAIAWLRQKLTKMPMRIGELRPHWMRATVKLTNDISTRLEQYLQDNFWLDRQTRRWREPTEEERALMDTSERQQARYEAARFLGGHLRRRPTDEEVLSWIEHLYHSATLIEEEAAGLSDTGEPDGVPDSAIRLYAMMPRLFQSVLKEKVDTGKYGLAQRQCRIAATKVATQLERTREAQEVARVEEQMPLFKGQANG
jgi:DNA modification methylase